jgi:hypothetical protein
MCLADADNSANIKIIPREQHMDISAIGRQFGLSEEQTRQAMEALAPVVGAGVRRNAQTPEGLQDMMRTIFTGGHDSALGDPDSVQFDRAKPAGDEILKQIFGSKDVSRGVAQQLSATSGIGGAILKKLLPIVATLVLGKLAKGFGGGAQAQVPQSGGGLGDILKDIFGGGGSSPMPQQRPMPMPESQGPMGGGSGNPLEDILGEILKGGQGGRNGNVVWKQLPPEQMGDILKDIFGGGFPGGASVPGGGGQGQWAPPRDEAVTRGRRTIEDATGAGTSSGNMADDLLNSVEKAIRRGG